MKRNLSVSLFQFLFPRQFFPQIFNSSWELNLTYYYYMGAKPNSDRDLKLALAGSSIQPKLVVFQDDDLAKPTRFL